MQKFAKEIIKRYKVERPFVNSTVLFTTGGANDEIELKLALYVDKCDLAMLLPKHNKTAKVTGYAAVLNQQKNIFFIFSGKACHSYPVWSNVWKDLLTP